MTTWTNTAKNTATYTNPNRNSATFTAKSKTISEEFFKIDDTFCFLIDDTYKLIIDLTTFTPWTNPLKS
jgi:hypothetical protein